MENKAYRTRIATYNIGDFTGDGFEDGSEEGIAAIRGAIKAVGAELWALQEDIPFYGKKNGRVPRKVLYCDHKNYVCRGTWKYNNKAFLCDGAITDAHKVFYTGDMLFHHPWFLDADIELGGRKVHFINIHVDWTDKYVRAEQFRQIIEHANGFERAVIIGDFNPDDCVDMKKLSDRVTYKEDLEPFIEAGYVPANGGSFGVFDTLPCSSRAPVPCDNIVVSPNIKLEAVKTYTAPWMNDHAILWADIAIY